MKINVKDATGAALDWMVAKAAGELDAQVRVGGTYVQAVVIDQHVEDLFSMRNGRSYTPSTDWAQGGPIIERERPHAIESCNVGTGWYVRGRHAPCDGDQFYGETLLIAAMRCYVASKLGNEVDVPDTLFTNT